ncbi:MAG: hypothetical protein RKE49_06350 [Oceanicaulis sp.]
MRLRKLEFAAVLAGFALLWLVLIVSIARPADMRALNRAAEPRPGLSPLAFADAEYRSRWTGWFTDKLVLAGAARRANRVIETRVFADAASGRVIAGEDGWLFLNRDNPSVSLLPGGGGGRDARTLDGVAAALARLDAAGIDARFALAPHKPSIYPDRLPAPVRETQAAEAARRTALMAQLKQAHGAQMVDVFAAMAARAREAELYLPRDTHWSDRGAAVMARALVNAFKPDLWDEDAVRPGGFEDYVPDLERLQGSTAPRRKPVLEVNRSAVRVTPLPAPEGAPFWWSRITADGPDGALLGPITLVGDSYAQGLMKFLAPYFSETRFVHIDALETPEAADLLSGAEHVAVVIVERHLLAPAPHGPAGLGARLDAALGGEGGGAQ